MTHRTRHERHPTPAAFRPGRSRRSRRGHRGAALLAVGALAFAFAACDDATDTTDQTGTDEPTDTITRETFSSDVGQPYPSAELTIRHQAPQAEVDVTYTLTCTPGEATLDGDEVEVDAQAACESLGDPAVIDWLAEGPPDDQVCTEQFGGEDTATIEGDVETAPIDVTVDRVDGCGISTWDELLAPLLPPAVGVT